MKHEYILAVRLAVPIIHATGRPVGPVPTSKMVPTVFEGLSVVTPSLITKSVGTMGANGALSPSATGSVN